MTEEQWGCLGSLVGYGIKLAIVCWLLAVSCRVDHAARIIIQQAAP